MLCVYYWTYKHDAIGLTHLSLSVMRITFISLRSANMSPTSSGLLYYNLTPIKQAVKEIYQQVLVRYHAKDEIETKIGK